MNNGTGLKPDFCSHFVLNFPPLIFEIGQAVLLWRYVSQKLLCSAHQKRSARSKNSKTVSPSEISIRYSESARKCKQKFFNSTQKVCWAIVVNYSGIDILFHIMTSIVMISEVLTKLFQHYVILYI